MALEKATITNLNNGDLISVMFNPEEYSLDVGNSFAEVNIPGLRTPPIQYVRGNLRHLKMELFFDTYELKVDVRALTGQITDLLDEDPATHAPPILLFTWGRFSFRCVLEGAGQKFTMFLEDGTPVRARLDVSFKQHVPVDVEIKQGFFIGPPTVRNIVEGEGLAELANELLGDPAEWRVIADANDIDNPRKIPAGTAIVIPAKKPQAP